jgi:uncharacterized delta-60 repeat protein
MDKYAFATGPDAAGTIDPSDSSSRGHGAGGIAGRWVAACLVGLLAAGASVAAPGELDTTFGDGGRTRVAVLDGFGYPLYPEFHTLAEQDDGKLLLAGWAYITNPEGYASTDLLVVRLNTDGSVDTSFDGDGWVSIDVVPNEFGGSEDAVFAVAVQPDGKILIAGDTIDYNNSSQPDMVIVRLNPDGSPDTTFGTDGVVVHDAGGIFTDRATGIVRQASGGIVVAGNTDRNGEQDVLFVRFDGNGALDTTFGTDGETLVSFGPGSVESVSGLSQDSNGALVAVGEGPGGAFQQTTLAAFRLTADGDLDTSFDTDGLVVVNFGDNYTYGYSLDVRSDNKLVLVGTTWTGSGYLPALALLNTDGSLDTSFGGDGTITPDLNPDSSNDQAFGVVVEPDNKVVFAGGFQPDDFSFAQDMFVARINADGSPDTSFGDGGVAIADFGTPGGVSYAEGNLLLRQSDGRLVVAGRPPGGGGSQETPLARFDSTGGGSGGVLSFKQFDSYWDESAGTVTIPVRRTGGATGPVSVQVRVGWNADFFSAIGAGEGCDYQDVTALLEWADGDYADKEVSVTLIDDEYQEWSDSFTIQLYGPAGADTAADSHQVSINYDENDLTFPDPGMVSIEFEKTVGEGDGQVSLVVSRTGAAQDCEVVGVRTFFGYGGYEATPGLDYTALSTIVQFGDGDTANKQVTVPIIDDALGERDETFAVEISPTYGFADNYAAIVTILDNDGGFAGVIEIYGDFIDQEYDADGGPLTLTRTQGSNGQVTVDYEVTSGTATAGVDFEPTTGTVVWPDGDTSDKQITVPLIDDSDEEPDETYIVTISNPTGGAELGFQTSATQTIIDDDTLYPGEFIVTSFTYEFDEDIGAINAAVQRRNGRDGAVSISYETADGTALDGADFTGVSGTLEFEDQQGCDRQYSCTGQYFVNIPIAIIDDADYEPDLESFAFNLSNPTGGATLGSPSSITFNIRPNDSPNGSIQMVVQATQVDETAGTATVQATRTGGSQGVVSIDYAITGSGATPGEDFQATDGTLTWADGETGTKDIVIEILDDAIVDPFESIFIRLENVAGGAILEPEYTTFLEILDDESLPGTLFFYSPTDVAEAADNAILYVYRVSGTAGTVSVNYATVAGSAVEPDDFTATSGTLTWADGDNTAQQVLVPIVDDALSESMENFSIVFSSPGGGLLVPEDTATINIIDDDNPGVISMSLTSVAVAESATTLNITATRSVGAFGEVSVSYGTFDGTAQAGSDYTAASGTLSWNAGETGPKTFSITVLDDAIEEDDENFAITLSDPTGGATLGAATTTVTIEDDDANPGTILFTVASRVVSEAAATVQIDVQRFGGSLGEVTIDYATEEGTALEGDDYAQTSGTLSWADGERDTRSFSVPIVNDTAEESSETFTVTLSNPTGGAALGTPATETVTIENDDAPNGVLDFSVTEVTVTEGGDVTLTVERTGGSYGAVSVDYQTLNSSAVAPEDFTATSGTLDWSDGDTTTRLITITTIDDETDEPAEEFDVLLSNPTGGAGTGAGIAVVTLEDNDTGPPGTLRLSGVAATVGELSSSFTISVTRTEGASGPATVDFVTQDDTAVAGEDYVATSGTLSWDDFDNNAKAITIPLTDDTIDEPDERFFIVLSNATGASLDPATDTATITIVDDDLPPVPGTLSVTGETTASEAVGQIIYTFSRTGGVDGEVGISYATTSGTASAGEDFSAADGVLTWADGDGASKTVAVTIFDDAVDEPNESFSMDISDPTGGASLGNASRTTVILDNDVSGPGTLSIVGGVLVFETAGTAVLGVSRVNGFDGPVSVDYATSPDTAFEDTDFTGVTGTLTWADGDGEDKFISVPIINDDLEEPFESFDVSLSNPGGGADIGQATAVVNIQDDDVPGTLAFTEGAVSVDETAGTLTVRVSRSIGDRGAVSVEYATASGSATDGVDFTGVSGTLTWDDRDSSTKTFVIPIIDDTAGEFDEDFTVALTNPTGGASLGAALLTVTIISDEIPVPGTVRMVAPSVTVDETAGTVDVQVERIVGSDGEVSIDYVTQAGSATAADFSPVSGTLTWADGDTANKAITVSITDDTAFEADEQFSVNLSNPQGGVILAEASTVVTIVSDDAPVPGTIAMADATASVNETAGTVTLSVTRTAGSDGVVGVSYATSAGSATEGADFTATSGNLSWADGESATKTIVVPILDDADYELEETFSVTLSAISGGAALGADTTTVTIINDDPAQQGRIEMASTTATADESSGSVSITVNRVSGSDQAVSVDYATVQDSAVEGVDFTGANGTLDWADGDSAAKTIVVPILDDPDFELDETFSVVLSNVTGGAALGGDTTTVTIVSDDAGIPGTIGLTETAVSIDETAGTVTLTVTRTDGADDTVSVAYATAPDTASAADFTATSGTLTWDNADSAPKTITVPILDDTLYEADEAFTVTLSGVTGGATLGPSVATVTILSADPPQPGTLAMSAASATVDETAGTVTLTVTRTGGADLEVGVSYATATGTATDADFTATSGTLAWADGDSAPKTITVPIIDDAAFEADEAFSVTLAGPTGGAILGADTTTVTIISDDAPQRGTIGLAQAATTVDETAGTVTLTVTRTGGTDGAVGVSYATAAGTAGAGDFTATSGTLTWADGDATEQTITVPITDDPLVEAEEAFAVTLSNPTGGAALGTATTTVTIIDDDIFTVPGVISLTVSNVTVNETDGTVSFTVTRADGLGGAVGVEFTTASGTAVEGEDFEALSGILNWLAGEGGSKTITVVLTDDLVVEDNETFTLVLSNPSGGATLGTSSVTITIVSEDIPPDTEPDPFEFEAVGDVTPLAEVQSNEITVAGINAPSPISIEEGEYSINGGPFTIGDGFVEEGATVRIRVIAAGTYETTVQATLTIGGVSRTFLVTTRPETTGIVVKAEGGGGAFGLLELLLLGVMALGARIRPGAALAGVLAGCLVLVPVARADDTGLYVGAGIGQSSVGVSSEEARRRVEAATGDTVSSMSFDETDTSYHLRIGYAFSPHIAIEAAYYQFGDTNSEVVAEVLDPEAFVEAMADAFPSNVHGPALMARLSWPFADRWAAHFRAGVILWEAEVDARIVSGGTGQFRATRDGEDLLWGAAVGWDASDRFSVTLEFTQAQLDDDVSTVELGVTWRTGWLSR